MCMCLQYMSINKGYNKNDCCCNIRYTIRLKLKSDIKGQPSL